MAMGSAQNGFRRTDGSCKSCWRNRTEQGRADSKKDLAAAVAVDSRRMDCSNRIEKAPAVGSRNCRGNNVEQPDKRVDVVD